MHRLLKSILIAGTSLFVVMSCNLQDEETTENCTPADGKVVELTTEMSGKTYKVGETVTIAWKIDRNQINNGQVMVDVSPDNGQTWSGIPDLGIHIPTSGEQYQCMSFDWKIGDEYEVVEYETTNSQCILRIHQYSDVSNGVQFTKQKFTVNK